MRVRNVSSHAVDLASGRQLDPGEYADVKKLSEAEQLLLDEGTLIDATEEPKKPEGGK